MYKRIVKGHQGIFPFLPHSAQGRRQVSLKLAGIIHILLSMHSLTVLIATKKKKKEKRKERESISHYSAVLPRKLLFDQTSTSWH